jgi:endonuclease/exonuclease/phosphatase family metal-dependent hydrolase
MAARPKMADTDKALQLACWNADGVSGRKLELDHFLGQYEIDVCLFNKPHLRSDKAFQMANYVCHCTDRLTEGGGTAVLVRRVIDHYTLPVQGRKHLEATAIQVMLVSKPVKILAVYLSPSRHLFASDLSAFLGGGLPILMAGDLNAKHRDWNYREIKTRGRFLCDCADENS